METDAVSSTEESSDSSDSSDSSVRDDSLPNVEDEMDPAVFEPLYANAKITKCGAFVAIMEFKRACRIPFASIDKLLELLQLLCPADNSLPRSSYLLRKFFAPNFVSKQTFCSDCLKEFVPGAKRCADVQCMNLPPSSLSVLNPVKATKRIMQST